MTRGTSFFLGYSVFTNFRVLLRLFCHHHDNFEIVSSQSHVKQSVDIHHVGEEPDPVINQLLLAAICKALGYYDNIVQCVSGQNYVYVKFVICV